jgi:tRNA nucleotidyltransferase/poly(A) polymerase
MIGSPFERFDEDWLRLLRAVRFAARFALRFDPRTWDALRTLAPMVTGISAERRTEELRLMLQEPNPGRAIGLLHTSGLLNSLLPDMRFSKRRIRKVINLLEKSDSKTEVWKHFFVDLPGESIQRTCQNLRLTRPEKKSLGIK